MNKTFQQFENSLTRQAELSMNQWTKELVDMNDKLMREPMQIVNALNEKKNLCTPGFLMRRQIQGTFTELLESAAEETKAIYTNLYISGNVAWPKSLIYSLSSKLEKYVKANQNQIVKSKEWAK